MKVTDLDGAVKSSKAPAIARAAAILRLLGKADGPMGLQPIARELGLVPSTCLYVLRTLVGEGLVAFDQPTKRYRLDAGILTLARQYLRSDPFPGVVQSSLDKIASEHGVTALGVQISGLDHIIALAVSESEGNFSLSTRVGSRFPALISATGRCIAAFGAHDPARLRKRFDQLRWDNPPGFNLWKKQVEQARRDGYAIDAGHYIAGVTVLAAPVYTTSATPSHAIVALGLEGVISAAGPDRLGDTLRREAALVSASLGGGPSDG
ncbi:IclR family transcriptional regulator [Erythrobacter alti]|uniref:IclR family transcriptional regulator n=1 Tax=Erythrobacter alti TaxID=1896145 RepID=UPI0030F429D8